MTKVMMKLGRFSFSVSTAAYQQLSRTISYRWPAIERVGKRPARQFVGIGNESIELSGDVYPLLRGAGVGQINAMREMAGAGEPLMLVDGMGNIWGKWCIEEIQETQGVFLPGGIPRKQSFTLRLGHYGEDE